MVSMLLIVLSTAVARSPLPPDVTPASADEPPISAPVPPEPVPPEPVPPVSVTPEPPAVDVAAEPIAVHVDLPPQVSPAAGLIPSADLPMRGPWSALLLLFLTGTLFASAAALRRLRVDLRPVGVLPTTLLMLTRSLRALATLSFIAALVALVPPAYAPALPWMILAAAAAVGWSARDVLPDIIGGLVIRVDGRVKVGQRIIGQGVVTDLGVLSATISDGSGAQAIPNRTLMAQSLVVEDARWPEVAIWLTLPVGHPPATIREALTEAALTTPWSAPGMRPQILQDPASPHRWQVVMRTLDAAAMSAFQGSLRERTMERLPPST